MMIKQVLLRTAFLGLSFAAMASAAKGDLFLSIAPAVDPSREPLAVGGDVSLQLGVNDATDFMFEAASLGSFGSGADQDRSDTRLLVGSYYTPYFGDIRPRFGGSVGLDYVSGPRGGDKSAVGVNLAFYLQGLYDVSDRMRLFMEAQPQLNTGTLGGFSTLLKVGLLFRLGK